MKKGGYVSCLKAVYSQTYNNIEVVIVDNESTDKTIEKTKKFKGIKYVNIKRFFAWSSFK